MKNQPKGKKRC